MLTMTFCTSLSRVEACFIVVEVKNFLMLERDGRLKNIPKLSLLYQNNISLQLLRLHICTARTWYSIDFFCRGEGFCRKMYYTLDT
jgi:hypothetical protein